MSYGNNYEAREVVGRCPFTLAGKKIEPGLQLPMLPDQLDKKFCGHYNRTGFLCGKCIATYGVSVFSNIFECVPCRSVSAWVWIKYFAITLGPTTLFFLIVVFLHVGITSGPANGFIFFAQILTIPLNVLLLQGGWMLTFNHKGVKARVLTQILVYPYSIWSLDFSDIYDTHTCLGTSLRIIDILALHYISAVYPLLLVVIAFVLIELHARNYRVIVNLSKPLCFVFARLRRKWQGKTSIIDAFATFILLSYIKFIRVSITLLSPNRVYDIDGKVITHTVSFDTSVRYFSKEHAPYIVLAFFVLSTFGAITPLLLIIYPTKQFQRCLNHCRFRMQGIRTFVEAFHGCYKDGKNGGSDRRFFAGLYFVFRIVIYAIYMLHTSYEAMFTMLQATYVIFLLLVVFLQPYKKQFYNCLDGFFFALYAITAALMMYLYTKLVSLHQFNNYIFILNYCLLFIPLIYMITYMVYWITYKSRWCRHKFSTCQWRKTTPNPEELDAFEERATESETDAPDRLDNPQRYEESESHNEGYVIPRFASEQAPLAKPRRTYRYGTVVVTAATY